MKDKAVLQFSAAPQYQQLSLRRLLSHVWKRSTFYREFYSSHGIRERDLQEIGVRDLPCLTKAILMENFDLAVTDPRLKKFELERWIQGNPDPTQRFSEAFVVIHSSGTSGSLGIFVYSSREWAMPDSAMASRLPPSRNESSERMRAAFYVAAHGHFAMVSSAATFDKARYDTLILSLLDSREHNLRKLNAFQPHRLYGYGSTVTALAEMSIEGALRIHPTHVFAGGDKLSPSMVQKIRSAWSASIYDTYGSSESKYIAFKESGDSTMAVLDELNIVEVLDDADRQVLSGQEGRVVLTNLYNYTLPLIRYETGDYVLVGTTGDEGFATSIRDIRGRINDALPVVLRDGLIDTIHPIVLSEFHVPGLEKIQFLSERPDFIRLAYIAASDLDAVVRNQFQKMLDSKGAAQTRFEVQRMEQIQNNPKTGKFDLVKIQGASLNGPATASRAEIQQTPRDSDESQAQSQSASKGLTIERDLRCAHQLFEQQAARAGNAVAAVCGESRLTYAELNARANQLAHHLRELGVGPETLVALCMTRSLDMVVGILGILKAGGAWLPLDPRHPKERKQSVLEDTKAPFLLTESDLLSELPKYAVRTVLMDADRNAISGCSVENPENIAGPSNLAYVMFTSGSLGKPKGVAVTHANLSHCALAMRVPLAVTETDIYLHTASVAFSSSVRQLFLPLTTGARSLIATIDQLQAPLSLFEAIKSQKVTILDFVPSYWRNCIDALNALDLPAKTSLLTNNVRLVATASEVLPADLPRKWRQELGHEAQLINMFGQTETTGIVTTYNIPADDMLDVKTVPIGKPIANSSIYLLDDQQRVVPIGSLGQIYVGGPGVSRGYLNLPESTAERFLHNPFSPEVGALLYKTGDLARYRPDGDIEFVGRVDDQVKIRGVRIEPGEVTAVLSQCPDLKECVVVAREDERNTRRLVAYVVPVDGRTLAPGELRRYLGERLPEYMIPSSFVTLEALPRLTSGKVDRHALPTSELLRPDFGPPLVAPRTDLERKVLGVWKTALGVIAMGVSDNFFDIGGNSLSAMYLLIYIGKVFGEKLPLAALYQAPTVAEFSRLLEGQPQHQSQPGTWSSLLPLQPNGSQPPFFWIHGESSNALLPGYLGSERPVYGLGHQSLDGMPARFTTVETIAAHYLEEMRTVQPKGPYFLGGYCFGGLIAFEIAHQLKRGGDDVALLAVIEPSPLQSYGGSALLHPPSPVQSGNGAGVLAEGSRHLKVVKTLELRKALRYVGLRVLNKTVERVKQATNVVSRFIKKAVCAFCLRFGFVLPVWVRSFYILRIYGRAGKSYKLQTYPGKVILFVQESPSLSPSSWDGLATEGVQIHKVTAQTHTAVLQQPHLRDWAEKLRATLEDA